MTERVVLAETWSENESGRTWSKEWYTEDGRFYENIATPSIFTEPRTFDTEDEFWDAFGRERAQYHGRRLVPELADGTCDVCNQKTQVRLYRDELTTIEADVCDGCEETLFDSFAALSPEEKAAMRAEIVEARLEALGNAVPMTMKPCVRCGHDILTLVDTEEPVCADEAACQTRRQ